MKKNYTYTIARIRALEARMLSPVQISRMVEATDLDRAFFVLNETTYADHLSATIHPFNYEEIIDAELGRIYAFLNYYAGENEQLRRLWRKYDFGNAKTLIRAAKKKMESVEGLSEYGCLETKSLSDFILKGEGSLPRWIEKPVLEAFLEFEEMGNPAVIDKILDNAFVDGLIKSESPTLKRLANVYKRVEFPVDLEGDNATIEILRGVKRKAFGVEPLIAFWLVKELEAKTIKQILISKKHHLPNHLLKERIRSTYV